MDCVDFNGKNLQTQLAALGYFKLSEEIQKDFRESLMNDIAEVRKPRYANQLPIDCLCPTTICRTSGFLLDNSSRTALLPTSQLVPQKTTTIHQFAKPADDPTSISKQCDLCNEEDETKVKRPQTSPVYQPFAPSCKFLKRRKVFRSRDGKRCVNDESLYRDTEGGLVRYRQREQSAPVSSRCCLPPQCLISRSDRILSEMRLCDMDSMNTTHPYIPLDFMYVPPSLAKTDPVIKYIRYKREWDRREEACEKEKRELRLSIRKRMMKIAQPDPRISPVKPENLQKPKNKRRKSPKCPWDCVVCGRKPCLDLHVP